MTAAIVIFRRELGSYFNAPLAYVVAIAYMLLNSSLYVIDLWAANQVSMRSFFEWTSWTVAFVIPAITMRSWAEDKKGATYELLLTLPMRSMDLVLGKFLAALVFFLFCLSGSLALPVILSTLATPGLGPEWGSIFAAYVGTILTASFLIAMGLFVSGLCRDQIEAFIVSLVLAIGLRLLGFGPIAGQIESVFPWLGNFLQESVSYTVPLGHFARGLIDLGDVLFFLTWTGVFLLLNAVGLEGRMRVGAAKIQFGFVALGLPAAALVAGLWLDFGLPRLDLTADKIYTVSEAAGEVLESIPDGKPVNVKLYFSPREEMPTGMRNLERDVLDKIEAFQRLADGGLKVEIVHLHADDAMLRSLQEARAALGVEDETADDERGEVEEQLLQEGVVPFRVQTGGLTGSEVKVVYASMSLTHGASKKEIIPQLSPGSVYGLEQDLMTRIYRLVHDKRPVVGLLAPIQRMNVDPQQLQLLSQLGIAMDQMPQEQDDYRIIQQLLVQNDQYELRRLRPGDDSAIPTDLDTLIIVRPEGLSERMAWEISRFLHEGGNVILASQAYDAALSRGLRGAQMSLRRVDTGLEGLLEPYGLSIPQEMVLNSESTPMSYSFGPFDPPVTVDFRWTFALDASNFDDSTALTNGVGGFVLIESSSPVRVDEGRVSELGLKVTPVLQTGVDSWTREVPEPPYPADLNEERPSIGPLLLAALAQGQFPPPAAEAPAWPAAGPGAPPSPPEDAVIFEEAKGSLFLLGTARPFLDDLIAGRGGVSWAGVLMKNAVDGLSLSDSLLRLTLRTPRSRPIKDVSRTTIVAYQFLIVGLAPLVYLLLGIGHFLHRRRLQAMPIEDELQLGGPA